MPRYFFDLHNDIVSCDPEGREYPDLQTAITTALLEARQMVAAHVADGKLDLRHHIQVRDETGAILHTVEFEDAVTVTRDGERV